MIITAVAMPLSATLLSWQPEFGNLGTKFWRNTHVFCWWDVW